MYFLRLTLLAFASSLVACGSSEEPSHAVDTAVTRIELAQSWLGAPPEPGGCTVRYASTRMTFDRGTKLATWRACRNGKYVDSSRTLTADEASKLEASLAPITYEENPGCDGYDGLLYTMTTKTAEGSEQLYVNANINCLSDGRRKAPELVQAYGVLLQLSPP